MQAYIFKLIRRAGSAGFMVYLLQSILLLGLASCQKDEVATRNYPRIRTLEVTEITQTGAKLSAEIISGDPGEVIEYGFVWSLYTPSPLLGNDNNVDVVGSVSGNAFSVNVETLQSNQSYYVRSFIKTSSLLIYGRVVAFKTLP